ncbi:carboxypeptidase regulatory-like domain-containing protein [Methanocella arvoryzae]|uniref:Carboxypeptidase regulatory-like domain-containing protein n=1 Tax=Methanocella arvoryzae (strain DSM 22066 / NBRC 105507 / MRE50) TaxID=351160 RepID=Q0W5I1_METAR|nr:carboxypeptidase regulatory-like domain-containing protein [Methanocella arvoryzae]CAJ36362.1 hypothetical protein RCIX1030 [Methanocella arvoryzae MRE50]
MRVNIFITCLLIAVLAFAFFASPSLAKTGTIDLVHGQVTNANWEPLPGADVVIEDGSHNQIARTISDSSGNFSFTNVSDGGTGRIRVITWYTLGATTYNITRFSPEWYPANQSIINVSLSDTHIATPMTTPAGDAGQAGQSLGKPFTALGQVIDAGGNGIAGATVTLYDGIYQVIGTNTTNQDGTFVFTNVIASSPGCKAKVNYTAADGTSYETRLNNVLWYPTDTGIVRFNAQDTQLTDYPGPSDSGFVWGSITDAAGNPLTGTVYLANETANLTIPTYDSAEAPGFISEVPVGKYTAYAEHVDANGSLKSKPVSIDVLPAWKYLDTNAMTFVADQFTPAATDTPAANATARPAPSPFNNPALLIMALIGAAFAIGATGYLKKRK